MFPARNGFPFLSVLRQRAPISCKSPMLVGLLFHLDKQLESITPLVILIMLKLDLLTGDLSLGRHGIPELSEVAVQLDTHIRVIVHIDIDIPMFPIPARPSVRRLD